MRSATVRERAVDRAVGTALGGYRAYLRLFAESPAAARLSPPSPVRRSDFEVDVAVTRRVEIADDVVALTLQRPDGAAFAGWTPGAHVDLLLPSGRQRSYSLCGEPARRRELRIAVRRVATGGGGSAEVHALTAGDRLRVRGPRNAFRFVSEPGYLFVAGGIGITAILPMVRAADRAGASWRLVHLGRDRASLPFAAELDALDAGRGRVVVRTDDEHGAPDAAEVLDLGRRPDGTLPPAVYLCGPPGLTDAVRALVRPLAPTTRFFSERFSAPPVEGGAPFDVELARTGVRLAVGADESLLEAVRRVVPDVAYSCRQGFCGSCRQRVLGGVVEHRDRTLLPAERADTVLTCVSRADAATPLVLDL